MGPDVTDKEMYIAVLEKAQMKFSERIWNTYGEETVIEVENDNIFHENYTPCVVMHLFSASGELIGVSSRNHS